MTLPLEPLPPGGAQSTMGPMSESDFERGEAYRKEVEGPGLLRTRYRASRRSIVQTEPIDEEFSAADVRLASGHNGAIGLSPGQNGSSTQTRGLAR